MLWKLTSSESWGDIWRADMLAFYSQNSDIQTTGWDMYNRKLNNIVENMSFQQRGTYKRNRW